MGMRSGGTRSGGSEEGGGDGEMGIGDGASREWGNAEVGAGRAAGNRAPALVGQLQKHNPAMQGVQTTNIPACNDRCDRDELSSDSGGMEKSSE